MTVLFSKNRRMRYVVLLHLLFVCLMSGAQTTTMKEVFKSMPDSLTPYLSNNNRLDFIDFVESNMEAKVTNDLDGKSDMTVLNDRFLNIQLNEASLLQMRLLPVNTPVDGMKQVICLVRTYGAEGKESVVSFYSCSWQRLDWSVAGLVAIDDLIQRPASMTVDRFQELKNMLSPYLCYAILSADDDSITFLLSHANIPTDDLMEIESIKVSKTLKWNGESFK